MPERRQHALTLLRRLTVEVEAFGRGFASLHDLHPTDVRAIIAAMDASRDGAPLGPSALAAKLGLSTPATSALLDRLEASGHLHRTPHPDDRRRVVVEATPATLESGWRYFGALNADMMQALKDHGDDAIEGAIAVFDTMLEVLDRHLRADGT